MCGKLCDAESLTREGGCNFIPVLKLRAAAAAAGTGWLSADTLEASASADGREIYKIRSEPGLHVKPYTGSFVRPTTTITLPIIVAINERFVGSFSRGALRCLHKRSGLTTYEISFPPLSNYFPDLRRDFDTPPYSQQIQVGGQAELRCHPPKGEPEARVTKWLKDGVPIDTGSDANFIQSAAGHLLINQARMADTANYTCVASNGPLERLSPVATVTVYGKETSLLPPSPIWIFLPRGRRRRCCCLFVTCRSVMSIYLR